MKRKPTVAIVGRPNVGKSTFVNRLIGARNSIVHDMPGVTRDRIYFDVEWQNKGFTVIDTGGIIPGDGDDIMVSIFDQARLACEEADKIIFLVDGKEGINPVDYDIANILRQSGKPIFLAVNKCDNVESLMMTNDFYSLAVGDPVGISALHGSGGVGDLLDLVTDDFEVTEEEENDGKIRIAIVGRPNAGKSSIVNALLNTQRVIVSNISGTTRDSIDSYITYKDTEFVIVDTAGIRKKSKVDYGVEKFAVDRAIRSIRECDVAVLVIDANEGISDQDKKISSIITESGKGIIVAINKWDLVEDKKSNTINKFEKELAKDIPFLSYAPKIFISALTKQRLGQIFDKSMEVYAQCVKRVSTGLLNKVINEAYALNPPTSFKGKRLKVLYTTQAAIQPPTFVLFVNNEDLLKDSYKRYLENKLREAFGFFGTPIRISVRERKDKKK
ncbi:TPA: ribosome biogenesis GTPase Der [Candidatus Gastranaerophilales bacterium HUM_6]|nr:ribosome biogenesis GTPase Der [Cyanobacteriota bacterium]CDE91825.1 gTPase Der [Fusobacterium sp. CAG:815]DAA90403.1 MAG TPA: ribosome biogenesis GTPase Der [Candidatus Gastranaerophilales bacterium HUM_6]DAA94804.1 MAG TPA: ribosome biogenesis GTPase Der [Candidatus Gastranaerophilales bacterium HUM_7]DAB03873.1 MAG TPA: ribosome biogenesis GTPase Der [Candidatus Gastranaerophilales bacterium HUM_12]DAB09362.1 MAG TPA: ribosome biogenesis GTPase Der [Candidatus Gastranaerophilales bacteri